MWAPALTFGTIGWGSNYGWSASIGFSSGYYSETYYHPWHYRPAYYSYGYCSSPLSYSLLYPTYSYPVYLDPYPVTTYVYPSSTTVYASASEYSAGSLLDYSSPAPQADYRAYASPAPVGNVYVNDGLTPKPAAAAGAGETGPVVYRSTGDQGALAWSETPGGIVNHMLSSDTRQEDSQRFLGKVLAGGWEATFESQRATAEGAELVCRGATAAGTGVRPTIIVQVSRTVAGLEAGQRVSVIGRLTALSVSDPQYAGGMLVLSDGDVSW